MELNPKEKKMISKELLSEVLNVNVDGLPSLLHTNEVSYWLKNNINHKINIYELAHKCKEWAFCNGYVLNSGLQNNEGYKNRSAYAQTKKDGDSWVNTNRTTFLSSTEPEAIFKACQWILDNKDKK